MAHSFFYFSRIIALFRYCYVGKLTILLFVILLFFVKTAEAQYYISGQDPSSIHWRKLETDKFVFIYPDYYEREVQHLSRYCDTFAWYNYKEMDIPFSKRQSKTPVVFHAVGSYSNGLSVWAPKRIELWTAPPQSTYSQPWLQQLMLHEYRHELQMEALNQDGVGVFTSVFGQHVVGAIAGLMVPMWYLEGDATWAETVLSSSGRGREGAFMAPYRALTAKADIPFSYSKAAFGSYKDYVPGDYHLGYLLVGYDRMTNTDYWKDGFGSVASKFWTLNPMYKGNFEAEYDSAMVYWKKYWDTFPDDTSFTAMRINDNIRTYSEYTAVGLLKGGDVIALKSTMDSPTALIAIDSLRNERRLSNMVNIYDRYFSQYGNKFAYIQMVPDKRWNVVYNNLLVYDVATDDIEMLTRGRNVFSPSFSTMGKIVALEVMDNADAYLLVFDTLFNEKQRIKLPAGYQYSYPAWSKDENAVFMIAITERDGAAIVKLDLQRDELSFITSPRHCTLSNLKTYGDTLFYISDQTAVPQVFSYNISNNAVEQQTLSQYGVGSYIVGDGGRLIYSDYTTDGYMLMADKLNNIPATADSLGNNLLPSISYKDIPPIPPLADTIYTSEPYSKWMHLFDFHSWAPVSLSPSSQEVDLGVSLFSQNLLGTSVLTSGWEFDHNTLKNKYYIDYEYAGWYPIINFNTSYMGHDYWISDVGQMVEYNQLQSSVAATLPWFYTSGNHFFSVGFTTQLLYATYFDNYDWMEIPDVVIGRLSASFTHHTEKPYRYLYHPWLQQLVVAFDGGMGLADNALSVATNFYFPSPISTHSIRIAMGGRYVVDVNGLRLNSMLNAPRGYRYINTANLTATLSLNYSLPLYYPDWDIASLAYIKRLYANLFADMAVDNIGSYKSVGLELNANLNVLQISTPITIGLRSSYLLNTKNFAFDFLFNIDV
ncbi:MAG: hypothetical protein J6V54_02600 [Bacteroidales bacterium]|nr:hypothetical protein [Bacteroidales bacterium]